MANNNPDEEDQPDKSGGGAGIFSGMAADAATPSCPAPPLAAPEPADFFGRIREGARNIGTNLLKVEHSAVNFLGGFNVAAAEHDAETHTYSHYIKRLCGHCSDIRHGVSSHLQAGGIPMGDRPLLAYQYEGYLEKKGFHTVDMNAVDPITGKGMQDGDVVVFRPTDYHPDGHIQMLANNQYISDFHQNGFNPWRDHNELNANSFVIYRHNSMPDPKPTPAASPLVASADTGGKAPLKRGLAPAGMMG